MTRMKISIAAVGVLALLATAVGVSVASRARTASAADVPVVQAVAASATAPGPASNPAVHLAPSAEAAAVDSSTAMAGVRTRIQPTFLAGASSVTIGEYRFTDDELATYARTHARVSGRRSSGPGLPSHEGRTRRWPSTTAKATAAPNHWKFFSPWKRRLAPVIESTEPRSDAAAR